MAHGSHAARRTGQEGNHIVENLGSLSVTEFRNVVAVAELWSYEMNVNRLYPHATFYGARASSFRLQQHCLQQSKS